MQQSQLLEVQAQHRMDIINPVPEEEYFENIELIRFPLEDFHAIKIATYE